MIYIQTSVGIHFDLQDPKPEMVSIIDIARALSHINRFTGHTNKPYSVAVHSLNASYIVPPEFALEALLHDAHEAYTGDVSSPLKSLLPDYRALENRIESVVRQRFGLPAGMSPEVKRADMIMLATERRDVLHDDGVPWPCLEGIEPVRVLYYDGWLPAAVRSAFIQRFVGLYYGE